MPAVQIKCSHRRRGADLSSGPIWVIAEHRSHRRSLVMLLRVFGLAARPFATTATFFRYLDKTGNPPPRCAIMDLYHPGLPLDGFLDAVARSSAPVPVLLLAGLGQDVRRQMANHDPMKVAVLFKPYEPPALLVELERLTGRR